jgi:hypothetical protein
MDIVCGHRDVATLLPGTFTSGATFRAYLLSYCPPNAVTEQRDRDLFALAALRCAIGIVHCSRPPQPTSPRAVGRNLLRESPKYVEQCGPARRYLFAGPCAGLVPRAFHTRRVPPRTPERALTRVPPASPAYICARRAYRLQHLPVSPGQLIVPALAAPSLDRHHGFCHLALRAARPPTPPYSQCAPHKVDTRVQRAARAALAA